MESLTPGNKLKGAHIQKHSSISRIAIGILAAVGSMALVGLGILFGYYTSR